MPDLPPHTIGIHATLSGHTAWTLTNTDGTEAARGAWSNMITDYGLDQFGTANWSNPGSGNTSGSDSSAWRQFLAVGTGSTTPAPGVTTMSAEVMRANTNGGFTAELTSTYSIDAGAGLLRAELVNVRTLDFATGYNLTEYGLAPNASGPVSIRELFRDAQGNPITLTVTAGQQLKLVHTLRVTLPYAPAAASFNMTGLGTVNGTACFFVRSGLASSGIGYAFSTTFWPAGALNPLVVLSNDTTGSGGPPSLGNAGTSTVQPYTTGSFKRVKRATWATSAANVPHYGWAFDYTGVTTQGYAGWKFVSSTPILTKDSTKTLTLDFEVSWGRA